MQSPCKQSENTEGVIPDCVTVRAHTVPLGGLCQPSPGSHPSKWAAVLTAKVTGDGEGAALLLSLKLK